MFNIDQLAIKFASQNRAGYATHSARGEYRATNSKVKVTEDIFQHAFSEHYRLMPTTGFMTKLHAADCQETGISFEPDGPTPVIKIGTILLLPSYAYN